MCNKINPEPSFTLYTDNNSKWIVDQSVRVKTDNNKQTKQKEHVGETVTLAFPRLNKVWKDICL